MSHHETSSDGQNDLGTTFHSPNFIRFTTLLLILLLFGSGASGVGRSHIKNTLLSNNPEKFGYPVPCKYPHLLGGDLCWGPATPYLLSFFVDTTRPQKKSEVDGTNYHFVSTEEMTKDIAANEFLEFGSYQGHMFGTKFKTVHQIHEQDKIAILDIEPQVRRSGHCFPPC